MKRTVRTTGRPPPMRAWPFHLPDWRTKGARPARAPICLRPSVPRSGSSATLVRAMMGPTPGTEASRASVGPHPGRAPHAGVDVMVDASELTLEAQQKPLDALAYPRHVGTPQP